MELVDQRNTYILRRVICEMELSHQSCIHFRCLRESGGRLILSEGSEIV